MTRKPLFLYMISKVSALAIAALLTTSAKEIYDHARSDVAIYSNLNFETQVTKNRDKGISIVHFYKDEGKSFEILISK